MSNLETMESLNNKKLAKAIRSLRVQRKMTQEELAKGVCQRTTLTHYENGDIKLPSITILRGIADKFGMTLDDLFLYAYSGSQEFNLYKKMRVQALIDAKQYTEALDICRSVAEKNGSVTDEQMLLYVEGAAAIDRKEHELARTYLEQAMAMTNASKRGEYLTLNEMKIAHSMLLNEVLNTKTKYSRQDMISSLDILKRSLDNFPISGSPQMIIKFYVAISDLYRCFNRYTEALECVDTAYVITKKSGNYDFLGNIFHIKAFIYLLEEQLDQTAVYLKKARLFYELIENANFLKQLEASIDQLCKIYPELEDMLRS